MARMAVREAPPQTPQRPPEDIRSGPPALLSPVQLRAAARRVVSIGALALIDVCGLALGLYLALIIRAVYYGESPILWGLPWKAEEKWLPFLALVTVLVFWRGGPPPPRAARARARPAAPSPLPVARVTLAVAGGT